MMSKEKTYKIEDYSSFIVTGILKNGKRFGPLTYSGTKEGHATAMQINLWKGNVWGLNKEGNRELLKKVNN